jgi:hypothetical protein
LQTGPWSGECLEKGANELHAMSAILCSDAPYLRDMDKARFQEAWTSQKARSFTLGDYWAAITALGCVGHKSRPKWQLAGILVISHHSSTLLAHQS